jgi:ABC-type lipoprotein release transport system permease subunit
MSFQDPQLQFGLNALDPVSLMGALIVLGATAMLAAYLPARTASLTDPNSVVRSD